MTSPLGYVVLARRPDSEPELLSAIFPGTSKGLAQAQNVVEGRTDPRFKNMRKPELGPVEFVIGEIRSVT